jgi:hypothetical protein
MIGMIDSIDPVTSIANYNDLCGENPKQFSPLVFESTRRR